jgi:hypothetical protein
MVRVGGGWDTLGHYLDKHDPCRCTSLCESPKSLPLWGWLVRCSSGRGGQQRSGEAGPSSRGLRCAGRSGRGSGGHYSRAAMEQY